MHELPRLVGCIGKLHDSSAAPNRRQRKATAKDFAVTHQVWNRAEPLLGAPEGEAEARHHLIEDHKAPLAMRQVD